MRVTKLLGLVLCTGICACAVAQTAEAYGDEAEEGKKAGLLDPSRLDMGHSVSFGMASTNGQSLQSQSLATTMLTYRFSQPVTLNFNFGMPIHSTYRDELNLKK
jgi:hypothetical protein